MLVCIATFPVKQSDVVSTKSTVNLQLVKNNLYLFFFAELFNGFYVLCNSTNELFKTGGL